MAKPQISDIPKRAEDFLPRIDVPLPSSPPDGLTFRQASRTKPDLAGECDINFIVDTFLRTGQQPLPLPPEHYGDISSLPNLSQALQQVINASHLFESLPAQLRRELGNDATQLEGWLANPDNKDRAVKLGLIKAPVAKPAEPAAAAGAAGAPGAAAPVPSTPPPQPKA